MSRPTPPIVIFGRDPALLESRRWVIEHAGFKVLTISKVAEAERLIQAENPELVILCHSLSAELCLEMVAFVHNTRPQIRILIMSAGTETCAPGDRDEAISSFEGPRSLIAAVKRLVRSPLVGGEVALPLG